MLEPDPDRRPDIFQVAHVAFKMTHRDNPVVNARSSAVDRRGILLWTPNGLPASVHTFFALFFFLEESSVGNGLVFALLSAIKMGNVVAHFWIRKFYPVLPSFT